jgi:hypothetical protein
MASPANLVLIVGYVAALGLGVYELRGANALSLPPAPPKQPAQALPPLEIPPDVVRSIAAYDTIIERPLFNPERRPKPPAAESAETENLPEAERVEIDGFRLTAVLRIADQTTVLIEDRAGKTLTLHAGEPLGNWRLDEILDDRVVLAADGRRETLMVYDFSRPAVKAPAAAPIQRAKRQVKRQPVQQAAPAKRVRPQQPKQR